MGGKGSGRKVIYTDKYHEIMREYNRKYRARIKTAEHSKAKCLEVLA